MKTMTHSLGVAILGAGLFISGCAKQQPSSWSLKNPEVAAQLKSFVAEKKAQESKLIETDEKDFAKYYAKDASKLVLPDCQPFFAAAAKGDWQTVSNLWSEMEKHTLGLSKATNGYPHGMWLQPVRETCYTIEAFAVGDEKYASAFGNNIIESIPPGSIYFGGTDPGRFLVTALQKSHRDGDPFFTLTQNVLADGSYLDYLRSMYGDKIYIPSAEDSQKCFQDYMEDAQRRLQNHQLKPGEDIKLDPNGRVQVSGQVAVMEINGLLVKIIFDRNPGHEFYIEESFPFDWMYPYLEPHGLIFKINRQPLPALSDEIVQRDHDYWAHLVQPMIGDWLNDDTAVEQVAAFAKKVFGKQNFSGFSGDPRFIQNAYSHRMFSKLRSSHGGLYAWRVKQATGAAEKERMVREADFAFRQAWALCPYSPEAVFRYVNFLLEQNRNADALLVAETAAQMPSMQGKDGEQLRNLVEQLQKFQKAKQTSSGGK
jgi:hypothetical protein